MKSTILQDVKLQWELGAESIALCGSRGAQRGEVIRSRTSRGTFVSEKYCLGPVFRGPETVSADLFCEDREILTLTGRRLERPASGENLHGWKFSSSSVERAMDAQFVQYMHGNNRLTLTTKRKGG